jgi:spore coat polysaccharide biosynthesis protein SpsF
MVLAILQARVSATRLSGQVLKPLLGKPMIFYQLERIKHAAKIDRLIVAANIDQSDDQLVDICWESKVPAYRGSSIDVLDCFYQVACMLQADHIVRLTGDCPLIDPEIIDLVIETHLWEGNDYTSNTLEPTYPSGLDVEVMTFASLEKAWDEAKTPSEREQVTSYIYQHPDLFKLGNVAWNLNLSHFRWKIDVPADLEFVKVVYERLYQPGRIFKMQDIFDLINANPKLKEINSE